MSYIETKVRYPKIMDNGKVKNVTESYIVEADSFTTAEAEITNRRAPYISGEFTVSAVRKSNISEVLQGGLADKFYKVKAVFVILDEKTATEKKSANYYLVQASDIRGAILAFCEGMEDTTIDYEITSISETAILEVYDHNNKD